jgi:hypothetical protein
LTLWARLQVARRREGAARRYRGDRVRMWRQLGLFSGLVCAGSVAGVIAWGARMPYHTFFFEARAHPHVIPEQKYALLASSNRWVVVYLIFYSVEFLCLILAKLMLLGRLSNHASHSYDSKARHMTHTEGVCDFIGEYALEKLHRAISKAVVACSVVSMLAMVVAAAYFVKVSEVYDEAAAACDAQGNDTNSSSALHHDADHFYYSRAGTAKSVQFVFEAIVLVVMSAAYMVFIPVCVAMFGRAERRLIRILGQIEYKLDHSVVFLPAEYNPQAADGAVADTEIRMRCDKGKELLGMTLAEATGQRRRFVASCAIVLITFFARASFDLLNAFSSFHDPKDPACGICDPCQSDAYLARKWLEYTPEFQSIVVAVSSPLPLAISLWLMMTKEDRMQLLYPAANEHARRLPEQELIAASLQNMAIELT